MGKQTVLLFIFSFFAASVCGAAIDYRPDLVDYSLELACKKYLSSGDQVVPGNKIEPGFWFWQDRKIKNASRLYQKAVPPEVEIVRPSVYKGDKDLLLASEMNYSEHGYVFVAFKDGTFKFQSINGKVGKSSISRGPFIDAIAKMILEGGAENVKMVVATHTHPHANFRDLGIHAEPNVFSEADLDAANYFKYYFEAHGIYFPLQYEIVYSKIAETGKFEDAGKIEKTALLFPERMSTGIHDVPSFNEETKSFLSSDWQSVLSKPIEARLQRILSIQ